MKLYKKGQSRCPTTAHGWIHNKYKFENLKIFVENLTCLYLK